MGDCPQLSTHESRTVPAMNESSDCPLSTPSYEGLFGQSLGQSVGVSAGTVYEATGQTVQAWRLDSD